MKKILITIPRFYLKSVKIKIKKIRKRDFVRFKPV